MLGGNWVWLGIATFPILAAIDSLLPRNMQPRKIMRELIGRSLAA